MFQDPRNIKPDTYVTCNGFVRADGKGASPIYFPSYWPYHSPPGYVYPTRSSHIQVPSGMPVYAQKFPSRKSNGASHKNTPSYPQYDLSCASGSMSSPIQSSTASSRHTSGPTGDFSQGSAPLDVPPKRIQVVEYPSDIAIHRELLWHRSWTASSSGIVWDIARPPSVASTFTQRLTIAKPDFGAAAMQKAVDKLDLWTDHGVLACYMRKWGPILVSKKRPTILDLLQAIYGYLSMPLTEDDIKFICSTPQNIDLLKTAREGRVRDGFEAVYEVAIKGPFRRSDVVGGHRRFQGIRAVKMGDGTNRLYFNLGPGPIPHI